jgi:hypothetical protein
MQKNKDLMPYSIVTKEKMNYFICFNFEYLMWYFKLTIIMLHFNW